MANPAERVSSPDPRARLISLFVGAVLLPSIALSALSFDLVPKLAKATKLGMMKQAERSLWYIEQDLERTARNKALEAARAVGTERLLEGRPEVIRAALREGGLEQDAFDSLRLEVSSRMVQVTRVAGADSRDIETLQQALGTLENLPPGEGEDSLPWTGPDSKLSGILRFKYSCSYVHGSLLRDYFEKDFNNPDRSMVIRVTEPTGEIVYEGAPTPDGRFEVQRVMESPSFKGLKMYLRYRDRSIEQEVHRWALAKMALIGLIDTLLGAGLVLVYSNVRREARLSRLKSDFVANVSHELKTPLALIRLFAETLELGRVAREEKAREYYRVINKESQRLTQLINNILDFSRIEAGRKEYEFERADLGRVVEEVLEAYRFSIEKEGFSLEVRIADDLPEVEVDEEAISQAVINLLNNAIKYSRDHRAITIEVRRQGDRVQLAVTDQGIGVPKAEQKKIFEKFYRAEQSLVHETKGSGLGLSLVRHIMEAHGGSVEVESTLGKGSTFTLSLPVPPAQPPAGAKA